MWDYVMFINNYCFNIFGCVQMSISRMEEFGVKSQFQSSVEHYQVTETFSISFFLCNHATK